MDEGIPYMTDAETRQTADYIRWVLRERKKASIPEFRRRCEECKRLAMAPPPLGEGERARLERDLGRGKGA